MPVPVNEQEAQNVLDRLIKAKLKPFVKKVDDEAYYAEDYLKAIGNSGLLHSRHTPLSRMLPDESRLVEETAKTCMTTAFNLWCHLASLTYVRLSDNAYLHREILPLLENGEKLGGTGLSNPMKFFAGMEKLLLKAVRTTGGYIVSGQLGAVSNLGSGHWFGIIADAGDDRQIMAFVSCDVPGLALRKKAEFLGVNGSATYSCEFADVFIPDNWLLSEQAGDFVTKIRPAFVAYQIPLSLGITKASIDGIKKFSDRQNGCNSYLRVQAAEIEDHYVSLREKFYQLLKSGEFAEQWEQLLKYRLDSAYLSLKAVQACMLHQGSAAYQKVSHAARRLREAYFYANLTPTIKHLEKMLCGHQ
ncbi:MAG TPA: acyl-CoA dehydrogenase family protein [Bacilli bacterium]